MGGRLAVRLLGVTAALVAVTVAGAGPAAAADNRARTLTPEPASSVLRELPARTLASPSRAMRAIRARTSAARGAAGPLCSGGSKLCWSDGAATNALVANQCEWLGASAGSQEAYTGTTVGTDGGWPATGDTYWGHIMVFYDGCGLVPNFSIGEARVPPDSAFALDPKLKYNGGKIRCLSTVVDIKLQTGREAGRRTIDFTGETSNSGVTAGISCPTAPSVGVYGAFVGSNKMIGTNGCIFCNGPPGPAYDDTGSFMIFEIIYPIKSSKPLFGIASRNHKVQGFVRNALTRDVGMESWVTVRKAQMVATARRSGRRLKVTGAIGPTSVARSALLASGQNRIDLKVALSGKKDGRPRQFGSKRVTLKAAGTFSTTFPAPKGATGCTVEGSWNGNALSAPVTC